MPYFINDTFINYTFTKNQGVLFVSDFVRTTLTLGQTPKEASVTYLLTFVVFMILILGMAIGVLFHRRSIQGSCGGLSSIGVERACNCKDVCENQEKTLYQIQEPNHDQR
ncbi:(Na+)-NQR maturation NqrM [Vibrio rhizosphaerae]|uniref:(Na+)-NQR maturation NqrM n=1 Tax=Vibrio rhizosphaerae TaxID=398736 RepID=UPI0036F1DD61